MDRMKLEVVAAFLANSKVTSLDLAWGDVVWHGRMVPFTMYNANNSCIQQKENIQYLYFLF